MTKFLDDISKMFAQNLESLQLGIVNINTKELSRLFKDGIASFPNLERLKLKIQYIQNKNITEVIRSGDKIFLPFNASELATSKIHDLQICIEDVNKEFIYIMEGKELHNLDLKSLTLIGKYTLNLFAHFIHGRP